MKELFYWQNRGEFMTLDEAIQRENKIAEENQKIVDTQIVFEDVSISELYCDDTEVIEEHLSNYRKCAEYHKQIADWLEELVMLRLDSCMIHMPERLHLVENGYNKALDDFAEKLNAKCDRMIKEKWNSNVTPISWAEAYADFKDDIDEIKEELKAGDIE